MNAERFKRLESAFEEASALPQPERSEYLTRLAVEDEEVASRLGEMLHLDTAGVDEQVRRLVMGAGAGLSEAERDDRQSGFIGGYRLLGTIGEGGFGIVYLAEQASPVRRMVAIKVIKPGMDTRQVVARFNDERQSLAMMDHPAVVAAIEAGTTADRLPYVVMPLVPGLPINRFCSERSLTVPERVGLMIQVCQGVQHAHGRGVIHRDLKPSNILVAMADGQPRPKVIDFGLAKALTDPLTPHSTLTVNGQVLGTPEYMAPEQAHDAPADARSDVYSLGSVLYELLAGRTPFLSEELRQQGRDGMVRTLTERVPAAPSRYKPGLARELDWITLRCLEKDPARRYATPDALAADLERFCAGKAVEAGPPARLYRLWRLVRRHRWLVLAAVIAGLSLVVGSAAALVSASAARRSQVRAEQVATMTRSILTSIDPTVAQGRDPELLLAMLDQSRPLLDRNDLDPAVQRDLCETFALAYQAVGRYPDATAFAKRADGLTLGLDGPDTPRRIPLLGVVFRGVTFEAMAEAEREKAEHAYAAEMRRIATVSGDERVVAETELRIAPLDSSEASESDAALRGLIADCERLFGDRSPQVIGAMRLLGKRMADERLPGCRAVLEEARRRAVLTFGEQSAAAHSAVAVELMAAQFSGASAQEVCDLGAVRIPAAERVLGWRSRAVIAAWQNYAISAAGLGRCDEAIEAFGKALRGESATRGDKSGMCQWIRGNMAVAALRCERWNDYLQAEQELWRVEPDGPRPAWESVVEIITLLHKRGDQARIARWLRVLERDNPAEAVKLRAGLGV